MNELHQVPKADMPVFQGANQMRFQHQNQTSRKLFKSVVVMLCSVGFVGCQRTQFPSNPFAGRLQSLPVPKMLSGLPTPKLPSIAHFPRPNFGNLVRSATTPSFDAIAEKSNAPLPPPARSFDTAKADQQIAASSMPADIKSKLEQARLEAEKSRDEIAGNLTESQKEFNSALASTSSASKNDLFSKITPKNQTAGKSGPWSDYQPDVRPGSSNVTSGGIAELAKVNHRLYDRYGKLTTTDSGKPKSEVAANKSFDFQPRRNTPDYSTEKVTSDQPDETLDGLRKQLMALKSRGSGSSDQFKLPLRSAVEIAGVAPAKPVSKEPEQPLHRGFGNESPLELGRSQQVVSVPDPTAPPNVLRAAVAAPRGLVQTTKIETPTVGRSGNESRDSRGLTDSRELPSRELPFGNALSNQMKAANVDDQMVNNDFVASKAPLTLQASTQPKTQMLDLPRQISDASKAALATAAEKRQSQTLPQINQQRGPLMNAIANPAGIAASTPGALSPALNNSTNSTALLETSKQTPFAPVAQPSATQRNSAFPNSYSQPVARQTQLVTTNQFFNRAAEAPAVAQAPAFVQGQASSTEPIRVADASGLGTTEALSVGSIQTPQESQTELPDGLTTGDGTYAPGSVRGLNKKSLW